MTAPSTLLDVRNLVRHYPVTGGLLQRTRGYVHAVDNITFQIDEGATFGLVGESGCGKSTTARQVLLAERPPDGAIFFRGADIARLRGSQLKEYRRNVGAVFQDPYSSLNPRMRVRDIVLEPMISHRMYSRGERKERVQSLLRLVGLNAAAADLFPHQFSGGQRQRVAIARALALEPQLLVLDEPVSALDVSIRAQVLNLLKDLQEQLGVSYLLIAHDLGIVSQMSDRVGVMYLGEIVESGPARTLAAAPLHPYTQALFNASLVPDPRGDKRPQALKGEIPSPLNPPAGCRFQTRCPQVMDHCRVEPPLMKETEKGHFVACHLYSV